jgi:predicted RNA polymerase sigma factor
VIQAELAACHARALTAQDTDWPRIVSLYTQLGGLTPSPVIELNRAVAISMIPGPSAEGGPPAGPTAALALLDGLADDPAMRGYHLLHAVRADVLQRLGRETEAAAEFARAAAMTANTAERSHLLSRADRVTRDTVEPR